MWWPFNKRIDPISIRLSSQACDISMLYQRVNHLEFIVRALDKRVSDLEKILKNSNIHITIVEK